MDGICLEEICCCCCCFNVGETLEHVGKIFDEDVELLLTTDCIEIGLNCVLIGPFETYDDEKII